MAQEGHEDPGFAHVLMIPYPSQAHIFPMLDLARQLVSHSGISVTLVSFQNLVDAVANGNKQQSGTNGKWNDAIRLFGVPDDRPGFDPPEREYPSHPKVMRESFQLAYNMEPLVEALVEGGGNGLDLQRPTCIVADLLNWWSSEVAAKLKVPKYTLNVLIPLCLITWISFYRQENKESGSVVIPMTGRPDFVIDIAKHCPRFPLLHRNGFAELFVGRWSGGLRDSKGLLVNSCLELESPIVDVLPNFLPEKMAVLAVGPLGISPDSFSNSYSLEGLNSVEEKEIIQWLDQQPEASVLYVSFGTTGMLSFTNQHVLDLAKGLESSDQRFLWVLRAPPDLQDCADAFPHGFEERVKGRALLVRGWAPQKQILAHCSTGAFLSSCGWNSALESLICGVPMVGWPSFADQPMVCRFTADMLGATIPLPLRDNFLVEPEAIRAAVTLLLQSEEGRAVRERAKQCRASIIEALSEGGTSPEAIRKLADLIRVSPR